MLEFLILLVLYLDMVYGWLSEEHSYVWYNIDMILIAHIFELLVHG
jgi:hypothetical protein